MAFQIYTDIEELAGWQMPAGRIDGRRFAVAFDSAYWLLWHAEMLLGIAQRQTAAIRRGGFRSASAIRAMRAERRATARRAVAMAANAYLAIRAGYLC
jgi:hypothetical protein